MEKDLNLPEGTEVTEPLKIYLNEIGQIPLLSEEEERDLGCKSASGDEDARRKLEEGNLRLVVSLAKHYTGRGITLMDLIQEGNIGLMHAAENMIIQRKIDFPHMHPGGSKKQCSGQSISSHEKSVYRFMLQRI